MAQWHKQGITSEQWFTDSILAKSQNTRPRHGSPSATCSRSCLIVNHRDRWTTLIILITVIIIIVEEFNMTEMTNIISRTTSVNSQTSKLSRYNRRNKKVLRQCLKSESDAAEANISRNYMHTAGSSSSSSSSSERVVAGGRPFTVISRCPGLLSS